MKLADLKALLENEGKPKQRDDGERGVAAKMDVLKELHKLATEKAGKQVKDGMSKVTVAAKDEKGLKEGLEQAEEIIEEGPEGLMDEDEELASDDEDPTDLGEGETAETSSPETQEILAEMLDEKGDEPAEYDDDPSSEQSEEDDDEVPASESDVSEEASDDDEEDDDFRHLL